MITKFTGQDGVVRYRARYGKGGMLRTFSRLSDAEQYEEDMRRASRRGAAGLAPVPKPVRYDELCDTFLRGYTAESKAWTENMLAHSRERFGSRWVREIRPDEITAWLAQLPKSDKTKKHVLERMRLVLNLAVEWGYLDRSPARASAVRGFTGNRLEAIKPFESWAEVLSVASKMAVDDAALMRFGCATGLRLGELWQMNWRDIDGKTLIVHGTKTDQSPRRIPLSKVALASLGMVGTTSGKVFRVVRQDYWRKSRWNVAIKAAGLPPRPPYQMRHTFATLALQEGVPLDVVSLWLGHKSVEVTRKFYAKYTQPTTERWAKLLDQMEES